MLKIFEEQPKITAVTHVRRLPGLALRWVNSQGFADDFQIGDENTPGNYVGHSQVYFVGLVVELRKQGLVDLTLFANDQHIVCFLFTTNNEPSRWVVLPITLLRVRGNYDDKRLSIPQEYINQRVSVIPVGA